MAVFIRVQSYNDDAPRNPRDLRVFDATAISSNVRFATDNTYDIGDPGANRPRDIHASRNIYGAFLGNTNGQAFLGNSGGVAGAYCRMYKPGASNQPVLFGDYDNVEVMRITVGVNSTIVKSHPTYADNAAAVAGGLSVNSYYKTASGDLRVVV